MTANGTDGSRKTGNTNRSSMAKNWVFTWNNYPETAISDLKATFEKMDSNYCFQPEVGESGTPHLQGCVSFKKKIRPIESKQFAKQIHWSVMRGTILQACEYCTKEDTKAGPMVSNFYRPVQRITYNLLRPNQREIADLIDSTEPNDRSIYWFWEAEGGWGKSFFCRYMLDCRDSIVISGAGRDILHGIASYVRENGTCPRNIIIDIPRCSIGTISYNAIEQIKNGFFFSGKYEGGMVRFQPPHIVIFANHEPEYDMLTGDRWIVRNLGE